MRVWLYGRLSNDDDVDMNSLENQLRIVRTYALEHGYQIVGESYDDNVSGMRFDRKGLNQVTQAVDINTGNKRQEYKKPPQENLRQLGGVQRI